MNLIVNRDDLLQALQLVLGAIERRQTMPILSHVLLIAENNKLSITATDLEVELITEIPLLELIEPNVVTVNAKKLLDICRTLPANAQIEFSFKNNRLILVSNKSRFNLATLSAEDFPNIGDQFKKQLEFSVPQSALKKLIDNTYFAMAQDDVRYYLNGTLYELNQGVVKFVTTDGHRLAVSSIRLDENLMPQIKQLKEIVIIPRKGIMELKRLLLSDDETPLKVSLGSGHISVIAPTFRFISKLVEGKFPEYSQVIPKTGDKIVIISRDIFKQALMRVSILSNEVHRGIRLSFDDLLRISANNPEQEEAKEEVVIAYQGEKIEIGFNVNYLIDICDGLAPAESIKITLTGDNKGVLFESVDDHATLHVIMPMRL